MPNRPLVVAFDVLETLIDLQPLNDRFAEIGQPTELVQPWFLRVQRDCMALTLSGDVAEFFPAARQALRTETGQSVTEEQSDHVLEAFATLPAHPDAEPAMRHLVEKGVRIGCLTVGNPDATARFLEQAGLDQHVEQVVTTRDIGTWKPAPAVYHYTAEAFDVPMQRLALVAVHAWDCHGAKRAGCLAGWCARLEGAYGDVFTPPDVTGDDLEQVAEGLIALAEY
ncbi:MAG: haloacid dehalogenase type II [Pseudohongiellaceae bacterium]